MEQPQGRPKGFKSRVLSTLGPWGSYFGPIYVISNILPFPLLQKAIPTTRPAVRRTSPRCSTSKGRTECLLGIWSKLNKPAETFETTWTSWDDKKGTKKKWELKIDLELLDQIVAQIMKHHEKWWNMKHHERWWKNVRMAQFPIPILKKKRCFPRAKSWNIVPGGLPDSRAASGSALPTPRNSTGIGPRRECRCVDICNTTEDVSRTVWTSDGNNLDLNGCWGPVKVWLAMAWYGLISVGIGLYWTWPKLEFAASTCGGWHAVATSKDLLSCQNSSKYSSTQQSEPLKNWLRTITLTLSQWFFHKLCYIPNKKDSQAWSTYDPLTLR